MKERGELGGLKELAIRQLGEKEFSKKEKIFSRER